MGGWAKPTTDRSVGDHTMLAVPGLMALNFTGGELINSSTEELNTFGTLVGGSAQSVSFGPDGALLFLGGGMTTVLTNDDAWMGVNYMHFHNLALYDLWSKCPILNVSCRRETDSCRQEMAFCHKNPIPE